jgi:FkbM family methyltransferase
MDSKFLLCEFARPLIRCLPFGRVRALALWGARDQKDASWQGHPNPHRVFYDRNIRAYVCADLREWGGRWHYFTGRYYDQANRLLAEMVLARGDMYIDVGANCGLQSLTASRLVGPEGIVAAIEPNPASLSMLQIHLRINGKTNVRVFNVGLSDRPGTLRLANDSQHSGTFTFREIPNVVEAVDVPVTVGDELLASIRSGFSGRTLVKIDTEGYEHHVLRGMKNLIASPNVAFVVEITDEWLRQTGSSAAELFADMQSQGYQSFSMSIHYPFLRPALRLRRLRVPPSGQHDVLFAREDFLIARKPVSDLAVAR